MEELSNREKEIINILIAENDYIAVGKISTILDISDKTVYRDIEKIEKKNKNISFSKKQGKGIKISLGSNKIELKTLKNIEKYSIEERRIKIFLWLLQHSKEYTSIYYLSNRFYVGRTSIISDLKYITTHFLGNCLTIEKSKKGTRILGREEDIRSKIREVIKSYSFFSSEHKMASYYSDRIDEATLKVMQSKFPIENIIIIESIIKKYEKNLPYTIGDLYYTDMIVHILIAIDRVRLHKYVESNNDLSIIDRVFYRQAELIAKEVGKSFNIRFPNSEIMYIYKYLMSMGVGKLNIVDSDKWIDSNVDDVSNKFMNCMLEDNVVNFNKNEHVYYAFQLHIRALIQRLKFRIEIKNPLTPMIKSNYSEVFKYIKKVADKVFYYNVSDDEIAYLTVYIQSLIENIVPLKKIVIVCHSGFGSSLLLKKRLLAQFQSIEIVDILSTDELRTYDLSSIDFVVSTVHIEHIDFNNIIYVSPLLLEKDIEKINSIVKGEIL